MVGFELGADDYVTKPFASASWCCALKAVLRRAAAGAERGAPRDRSAPSAWTSQAHRAFVDGPQMDLTAARVPAPHHLHVAGSGGCSRASSCCEDVWEMSADVRDAHGRHPREAAAREAGRGARPAGDGPRDGLPDGRPRPRRARGGAHGTGPHAAGRRRQGAPRRAGGGGRTPTSAGGLELAQPAPAARAAPLRHRARPGRAGAAGLAARRRGGGGDQTGGSGSATPPSTRSRPAAGPPGSPRWR